MKKVSELTGRPYHLFDYVRRIPTPTEIIVIMGSGAEAAEETIDYMNARGAKVGMVKVRLYRPFCVEKFVEAIPASVKKIAVLDRTKEPGSLGEPLYLDVIAALDEAGTRYQGRRRPLRPGLQGVQPDLRSRRSLITWLTQAPKNHFTVGINDDVTGHFPAHRREDRRGSRRHDLLQVLRSGFRWYRWRQQELHQDHR